jgi:hypothetical protein
MGPPLTPVEALSDSGMMATAKCRKVDPERAEAAGADRGDRVMGRFGGDPLFAYQSVSQRDPEFAGQVAVAGSRGIKFLLFPPLDIRCAPQNSRGDYGKSLHRVSHFLSCQPVVPPARLALDLHDASADQASQVVAGGLRGNAGSACKFTGWNTPAIHQDETHSRPRGVAKQISHESDIGFTGHRVL